MSNISGRKISIRTRIFVIMLSLIAAIFLMVLAVFNLLVGEYIKNSVNEQLKDARQLVHDGAIPPKLTPGGQPPPVPGPEFIPDMRRLPGGPADKAEVMVVSDSYELIFPNSSMSFMRNYDEINALAAQLKHEQVNLQSNQITRVKASEREYYFMSAKMPPNPLGGVSYLVYYIDMTAIKSFAGRINIVLLAVMGIAGILAATISIFLSGLIAKPVRELTRFAVRIGKGNFSRNTFDYSDIELAELAESMNKAAVQLDAYDKEQKQFFQNVSHELRTPLQAIKCNAEGIKQRILDPEKSSRVIISETDRLRKMVEDLLYLSRIDSITTDSKIEEYDLRELLSNCVERQRSLAAERNIQFVFEFDDQPVNMCCDEKHISRAFSNLISNAIRYARTEIILACRQANGRITIAVADDGEGISNQDLPHIFDRFYKGSGGKYGIGLSIVKSVIEQHRGRIEAQNTGMGTLFTITF
ncbi:HAMP domain-containing sensor histidine kinase [Desulfoscipio sp. XC116]|uniref:sensor histidine kinase n=1 Tax=Desulfoscipio sp. XC116 TaxID=3144975 RepID=UPI00325ADB5B